MSFASPNRPTSSPAPTASSNAVSAAAIGMCTNPYVDTTRYYSSPVAATVIPAPATPLGRELRYRPAITYTPVLASARFFDRTPRASLSELDMDDLNRKLEQLCLSDHEEEKDDEEDDDVNEVEPDENESAVAPANKRNHRRLSTIASPSSERPDLLGRVPVSMIDAKTHQVTSVLRSSRLVNHRAKHQNQQLPAFLGRVPQPVMPKTNKPTVGLRSSRLPKS